MLGTPVGKATPNVLAALFDVEDFRVGVRLRDGQVAVIRRAAGDEDALVEFLHRAPDVGEPDEVPQNLVEANGGVGHPALSAGTASFMVAQTCNLRCVYCFAGEGDYGQRALMDWDEAKRGVDTLFLSARGSAPVHVNFFGGEPMLAWPLIERTVQYAEELSEREGRLVGFSMTTNATRVTEERALFLAAHQFMVLVSIDGTQRDHDLSRPDATGRGSWSAVVSGAKLLIAALGPGRVEARATLRRGHASYEEIEQSLRAIGFCDMHLCIEGASVHSLAMHSGPTSPWNRRSEYAYRVAQDYVAEDLIGGRDAVGDDPLEEMVQGLLEGSFLSRPCGVGDSAVAVSADGKVFPCHRFVGEERFSLGETTSERAKNEEGTKRFLDLYRAVQAECRGCPARRFCAGGCLHESATRLAKGHPAHDADECDAVRHTFLAAITAVLRHLDPSVGHRPVVMNKRLLGAPFRVAAFRRRAQIQEDIA